MWVVAYFNRLWRPALLHGWLAFAAGSLGAAACACAATSVPVQANLGGMAAASFVRVPEDHPTIQAAVDAAPDGGVVLIAPGVYHEEVRIAGKSVRLASHFLTTRDPRYIETTVLDGSIPAPADAEDDDDVRRNQVILVEADAGPRTAIVGLTIRDGDDGISCHARIAILFNLFLNNSDAIDYEDGGGECRFNRFIANDDDAVDYDGACDGLCANNLIHANDDDGIEIRFQPYRGEEMHLVIRDNVITNNGEDGIQIVDYPGMSDRRVTIERNLIAGNAMAGIGFMGDANTRENYEGAPVPEPVTIVNNTLVGNYYGITGGASVQVVNNVIVRHLRAGMKNIAGKSTISHNLLWQNGEAPSGCRLGEGVLWEEDPRLDDEHRPRAGSPCLDAGTLLIDALDVTAVSPQQFRGRAPDLGAFEIR